MQINATPSFLKQANKLFKKNSELKERFKKTVEKLVRDPFDPSLRTHKLKGDLKNYWSCSVAYDVRLIFKVVDDIIELIDIGHHEQVY